MILPLIAMVTAVLCAQLRWRVAAAWLLAIISVLGAVLTLKVCFYACGWLVPAFDPDALALRSPSGHAASAAAAYGGIAALVAARTRLGAVPMALAAAVGMAALIGTTRIALGAHSVAEVVVAASIGIVGAVAFAGLAGRQAAERSGLPVLAGALIVVAVFHGRHLPAEGIIQRIMAETLRQWVTACRPSGGQDRLRANHAPTPTHSA